MLYAAHLFCPCDTEDPHIYDENTRKPCIGLCGHTVCLCCIEKNVHMACPICNQPDVFVNKTPNFAGIELINDCRNNFWQLMKNWWSGENINSGPCSKCSDQSLVLRICLTCDEDNFCSFINSERRLKIKSEQDLLKLSRHVLCSECAINHHNGHQTINIERIKYSKQDIKTVTSKIIMGLFRREMPWKILTFFFLLWQPDYKKEGECGNLGELIRMELITKYMEGIDRKREELRLFSLGETPCECNRLYKKLEGTRTEVNYEDIFSEICESEIGMFSPGCPLFLESQLENRLKLYEIIGETPPEQVTPEPYNVIQCPLCVILDHSEHKKEHHRQNWLGIVENIWKNELPPLSNFCCPCLDRLIRRGGFSSCGKWEGTHRNPCHKPDCLMKDLELWKYQIISDVHLHLACIMLQGCRHENLSCQLKRIRLQSSAIEAYKAFYKIQLRENSREELNSILKNVDDVFEQLKNRKTIYEAEIQQPECECSKLWNKNQKILKKLVKESRATKKQYLEFKNSMEEMAEYSLKKEILGCPMDFDHGIVLDPTVMEELKDMDLVDSFENMDSNFDDGSGPDPDRSLASCWCNFIKYCFNSRSFFSE
ncbi:unnamed protein product [Caenorhabditis brenneri]